MYDKILFFICCFMGCISVFSQTFQETNEVANRNFHDLNTEPLMDGTNDFIVGGNLFDSTLNNPTMFLKRVNESGSIVWFQRYNEPNATTLRLFDLVTFQDMVYATGYIIAGNTKKAFIAKIDALTGNYLDGKIYEVSSPNQFSRGLSIIYTQSDVDNDTNPDPGLVIGGFHTNCFALDLNCDAKGFVLRTDINLNPIWTHETESNLAGTIEDYDAINSITETLDGFFVTGATNYENIFGSDQQAVLAHKMNFDGTVAWDTSYEFGNAQDKSVDAHYDPISEKIYALCNYSSSHNFAITSFENATGSIDFSRSWWAQSNDLDRYGFTLYESLENPTNLIIAGYDKDENWSSGNTNYLSNSSIIIYQFEKDTGNQIGPTFQYLVPHTEPTSDDYNFWTGQFPLIYFPSMSFSRRGDPGTTDVFYYHVGYRTNGSGLTNIELIKTLDNKINECDRLQPTYQLGTLAINPVTVVSSNTTTSSVATVLNAVAVSSSDKSCQDALGTAEYQAPILKLFPNPTSEKLWVTGITDAQYSVIDIMGKTVRVGQISSGTFITVDELANGLYFLSLHDQNKGSITLPFIKQ